VSASSFFYAFCTENAKLSPAVSTYPHWPVRVNHRHDDHDPPDADQEYLVATQILMAHVALNLHRREWRV
jgi:hypothetical protein